LNGLVISALALRPCSSWRAGLRAFFDIAYVLDSIAHMFFGGINAGLEKGAVMLMMDRLRYFPLPSRNRGTFWLVQQYHPQQLISTPK